MLDWSPAETVPLPFADIHRAFDLAADASGDFHLIVCDQATPALYYGHRSGEAWNIERVTWSDYTVHTNLALAMWGTIAVLDLALNAETYSAGDLLSVELSAFNPGPARSADLYVLLEAAGQFWFYPSWGQAVDRLQIDLGQDETEAYAVVPPVALPDPLDPGGPFFFHAAAFEPGTLEAATLASNVESAAFSFV